MKRLIAWLLRLACLAVIGVAVYTIVGCLMHVNDDYSAAAVLGVNGTQTFQSDDMVASVEEMPQTTGIAQETVDEQPTVIVYTDGAVTVSRPYTTATAAFGGIVNSIVADLNWYLDGVLVAKESQRLLVEGSTVSCKVEVDLENAQETTAEISLEVIFNDKSVTGKTDVSLELPQTEESASEAVVIQTAEIPVTAKRNTDIYTDATMKTSISEMKRGDTGLFLSYEAENSGLSALQLLFADGTTGWVEADDVKISEEDHTTDEDYSDEAKMGFVNSMQYDSQTGVMVWVNLYTQKVNVFYGYIGNWELKKTFDCATGVNTSPTTTGAFHYAYPVERWNLGSTYVEPVLVFNGGEAFTSQPYDSETQKIADKTIGEPASGGSVWMLEEDIKWLEQNLPLTSLVVVY